MAKRDVIKYRIGDHSYEIEYYEDDKKVLGIQSYDRVNDRYEQVDIPKRVFDRLITMLMESKL